MIFPLWNVVVGPKVALKAHPYKLENGILKVIVYGSTWTQQLSFMKEQIITGYMDLIGEELVKDIQFYTGKKLLRQKVENFNETEQLTLDFNKENYPDEFQLNRIKLSEEKQNSIEEYVRSIQDEKLKSQIRALIEKDFKAKAWKENMGWKACSTCNVLMDPTKGICSICSLIDNNEKKKKKSEKKKKRKS